MGKADGFEWGKSEPTVDWTVPGDINFAPMTVAFHDKEGEWLTICPEKGEITLREVVEAVEGPLERTPSSSRSRGRAPAPGPGFLWPDLLGRFAKVLDDVSLEEVCRRAARQGVPRARSNSPMYFI